TLRTLQDSATQWSKPLFATAAVADRIVDLKPNQKESLRRFVEMIDRIRAHAEDAPPTDVLERIIELTDFEAHLAQEGPEGMERLENVRELLAATAEWSEELEGEGEESRVEQFLAAAALMSPDEVVAGDANGVTLMTVHTAKGLEWHVVVLAGMEDGLFPLSRSLETPEGLEEERRLAYVALTRAKDRAYVTWARARRRGGQFMPGTPSRFIRALPGDAIEERRTSGVFGAELYRRSAAAHSGAAHYEWDPAGESQDAPRYVKGERVLHRQFGAGVIRGISGSGRGLKVVVEFDDEVVGTKHLLAAYAGLERDWEG
ncbi:MAG: 3'-5' exonuclease, partial [Gemmatimonadales bacterium]